MAGLTALTLSHFRSHKWVALSPGPGPVAIYGPNGAGKTNILEAISLFSPGRGLRRAGVEDMARAPEAIGWKISAELEAGGGAAHQLESWSDGSARQVQIDGKPAPQLALARIVRVLWLVPSMDRLWTEGAGERRRFLDRVALSFTPGHGAAALAYEKAMRERNRLFKDEVRDAGWFDALEDAMARAGADLIANRRDAVARLAVAQAGRETGFPRAALTLTPEEDGSADALRGLLAASRGADRAAGRALVGPHRADLAVVFAEKGVPARLCSTGEQKALLISLVLANARGLADALGIAPVLLLDEVAAHLDAGRRARLFAEILDLGGQAWMTGTGPELFAELSAGTRFAVTEQDGASLVAPG